MNFKSLIPKMLKNKKGVFALDLVGDTMVKVLLLAITAVAVIMALVTLQNSNIFTSGSQSANQTNLIVNNITSGTTSFFGNVPTFFNILAVVTIILFISLIIYAVYRFANRGGGSDGMVSL